MDDDKEISEEELFAKGPLSVLLESVKKNTPVLINCRNNKKLLGTVKAFDRHFNMVLENVVEMWTVLPKKGKGTKKATAANRERYMNFLLFIKNVYFFYFFIFFEKLK